METIKVKSTDEIEVKRFYLPIQFPVICTECGNLGKIDLEEDYLSYPEINTPIPVVLYCDNCGEHTTEKNITLRISIDVE